MQRIATFLLRLTAQIILWFVGLSLALVILFAYVPVPITATMILDENGATRDWEPLEEIDPDLVAAVIAAEDAKFCQHAGFDTEARKPMSKTRKVVASAAARRAASRPQRTSFYGRTAGTRAKRWRRGSPSGSKTSGAKGGSWRCI